MTVGDLHKLNFLKAATPWAPSPAKGQEKENQQAWQ